MGLRDREPIGFMRSNRGCSGGGGIKDLKVEIRSLAVCTETELAWFTISD